MSTVGPLRGIGVVLLLAGVLSPLLAPPAAADEPPAGAVHVIGVDGPITAVTDDRIADALEDAVEADAAALVVQLDTPGGQLTVTRDIVQRLLLAEVPSIVHVTPAGARAGSAGTFITYAANIAAMSPGTTIGAATPVMMDGGEVADKIVADSVSYAEALAEERGRDEGFIVDAVRDGRSERADVAHELGAIDLLARDIDELLTAVDGEEVTLGSGATVALTTADAPLVEVETSWARRVLETLATPDIALLLVSIGTLAVIYELANPGLGFPGILGAVMLVLGFYSLAILPTTAAGVFLVLLGLGLLVAEIFAPGIGVLAGGGALSLLAGGLLLFDAGTGLAVSWTVLVPTVLLAGAGAVAIAVMAARLRRSPPKSGTDALVGSTAEVRLAEGQRLQVWADGGLWQAECPSGSTLKAGDVVRIIDRRGLRLFVEPSPDARREDTPPVSPS